MRARVTWALMLDGLAEACNRLAVDVDPDDMFKQVFEAVDWAGGAREYLRAGQHPVPPELEAFWFARKLPFHAAAEVVQQRVSPGSEVGRMVIGMSKLGSRTIRAWVWPDRAELRSSRPAEPGHAEYDAHLAGKEVVSSFTDLLALLRGLSVT